MGCPYTKLWGLWMRREMVGGEEEVGLRSSNQARLEGGLGTVIEALNFQRRSFPRIGVRHFGSTRKEWENGVP